MSLDDVRHIATVQEVELPMAMAMAVGAGPVQWERPRPQAPPPPETKGKDNVLPFSRRDSQPQAPPPVSEEVSEVDLHMQREAFRLRDENLLKKEGVKLYKETTEAHIYRASKDLGNKLKFAHTNGVLINKKQD